MNADKRAKILENELKAQEKFNKKYYREEAPEKKKRALFVFLESVFENLGKLFMLNIFYGIIFSPVILLGFMVNLILTNSNYNQYISNIPLMILIVLILGIILGPLTAASFYIYKNLKTGKHIYFFSDFFKQFKSNFKQSFIFGVFDAVIAATILSFWTLFRAIMTTGADLKTTITLCLIGFILFLYYSMRPYVYLQIVSINLKVPQIVRNALFFAFLGVKENFLSLIIFAVLVGIGVLGFTLTPWLLLFWLIGFSLIGYSQVFSVYKVFHHHLIAPEEERAEKETELDSVSYEADLNDNTDENQPENKESE
ncbi:MAG TPA: DUF624 domain-containing protein [Oscillospiraceae bacterium]|nr:DUF624 domain-containing protein [Oscillospiraceae bacterium]HPK34221.1 DUF624 domain-containing protein [Oscillospiraceae bacterium]HPR74876.1 DUF624 domain-containing protein [Oscillospiraceae bacterium]